MGWEAALSSVGEFASRNLCRPGWLELVVVLVLVLAGTCCGVCLGFGWGFGCGFGAAKFEAHTGAAVGPAVLAPVAVSARKLASAGSRRLSLYNVKRG